MVLLAEPIEYLQSAAFTLRVPAGTTCEPAGKSGLAHLVCDLVMRGSESLHGREFVEALDRLGVNRSEGVGASHASFRGAALARNLGPALRLYADAIRRPELHPEQFEACRALALQDARGVEDEPGHVLYDALRERFYPRPWGRSDTGRVAEIEALTLEDVRAMVRACYRPNGALLGVAGRVQWPALVELVEELFGDWAARPEPALDSAPALGGYAHLPYASHQTHLGIAFAWPSYSDPDFFQAWGAVGVLAGGSSARLFMEVREKRGLCYSVHASLESRWRWGGVLCHACSQAERAQETLDVMLAELVRLGEGIERAELDRHKARIKSALIMQQESSTARSAALVQDWYHLGRVRTLQEVSGLVDALTHETINAYLAQHPPRAFTVVTLGPKPLEVKCGVS
jgi:predicted Zn-dependent peptidase